MTFESGWSNNAAGSTFANVEYRKKGDLVHLRGIAERMTGTNRVVFTLPVGFRPQKQSAFPAPLRRVRQGHWKVDHSRAGGGSTSLA